jgi:hypothetical protein
VVSYFRVFVTVFFLLDTSPPVGYIRNRSVTHSHRD